MCLLYGANSGSVTHLFLHLSMANFLWNTLFGIFDKCWEYPATLDQFLLTSFAGFRKKKEVESLCQCAIYAIVLYICSDRNSHTFNDKFFDQQILWDKIKNLAFI